MRSITTFILLTLMCPAVAFAQLGSGLELYYTFDNDTLAAGGIVDSSGNNRSASPIDDDGNGEIGLSFSNDVPSQLGSGMSLDARGVTDFLVADEFTGIAGGANRTISAWIKSESVANQHMVEWGTNNPGERFTFRLNNSAGNGTLGGIRTEIQTTFVINDLLAADGEWHHVAVVYDVDDDTPSKDDINLYLDGVIAGSTTTNGNDPLLNTVLNNGVAIAGTNVFSNRSVDGFMDEVAIWSRALAPSEIASLAAGARVPEPSSAMLALLGLLGCLSRNRLRSKK